MLPSVTVSIRSYVSAWDASPLARWSALLPWDLTARAEAAVRELLKEPGDGYALSEDVAVHVSATVESGAVLKGPLLIGPGCFVAAGAYLRGGCWLGADCVVGPGTELKSSFVFARTHLAHFNFVGDSVIGSDVNLEAGSIVCNHRNERADREVQVRIGHQLRRIGVQKFGALLGDGVRIGANAVVAPGALLAPGAVVNRLALYDAEVP